ENCSVALWQDGHLASREELLTRGHAERILPMVDELLRSSGVPLSALAAIAFGRGPGAFTGVRLAASVTQGLAFGAGVPVVPVSDLAALAQRVLDAEPAARRVLVCNDARMHELYWGCFERGEDGYAGSSGEERVGGLDSITLPTPWAQGVHATGSGFSAYPGLRAALGASLERVHEGLWPRAAEIARLAVPLVHAGTVLPAAEALPVYLRDQVAHVRPQ
ncbi:MAG TPA: tRNA (adenosine(37)-N6)-threonylcarbamoyltransferase complex dimerization subunit type 1 TsaB, partial [Candidatus Dormibacteraeota bacterium]|nr:tRNA (adenosine(37)-N6)-threonylcarbamoyltransferase complex dimerization subunit type 1 TsaB [Candidatus Dormibacteraeota bacterium]